MALTSTIFNYNVAKIIDTPWNTIINGLNYTKTALAPLGLRYTLANNKDSGMLLKEVAGNSLVVGVPVEDFSWLNAARDYDDPDKYWILNTSHRTDVTEGPAIYLARRCVDTNGFEYSELTQPYSMTKARGCGQILYQDASSIFVYYSNIDTTSGTSSYIYRYLKNGDVLKSANTYSCSDGIISLLDIKDGYIYFVKMFGTSTYYYYFSKIEISSGLETTLYSTSTSGPGILTSYPSNVVNEHFYIKNMRSNTWYRCSFTDLRKSVTMTSLSFDEDASNCALSSTSYFGHVKRFTHIFEKDGKEYLVVVTLNSYSASNDSRLSNLVVYEVDGDALITKQKIVLNGLSLIPRNDWNTLFIGTSTGIRVFNWDSFEKQMVEKPTIYTTCQQFGFDIDDRLWIMDGTGNVVRYTYNQPLSIDYHFELPKYEIGTEVVETYADLRVFNYMGELITSKIKLKAIGNFTFMNSSKELELILTSDEYTRIPVYLNGSGRYEIRIKD